MHIPKLQLHVLLPSAHTEVEDSKSSGGQLHCSVCDDALKSPRQMTDYDISTPKEKAFPQHVQVQEYHYGKKVFEKRYCGTCFLNCFKIDEIVILTDIDTKMSQYFTKVLCNEPVCYFCKYIDTQIDHSVKKYIVISYNWHDCFYVCHACRWRVF